MLVSVIIRSFHRRAAVKELLVALRTQTYPTYEIVLIEMSDDPALVEELENLGDSRLRVLVSPPRDPPAARNEAVRHAKGEILVFLDDDDLPLGDDLVALHVENYRDPRCMGVVGRLIGDPAQRQGPRFPRVTRAMAMRQTFFLDTVALVHGTLRKEGIDFLIGSNASVRRSLVERLGGWDEGLTMNEEQSFAIKFKRAKLPGEMFVFDPRPLLWRRTDVPGGIGRRASQDWHLRELEARLFYYQEVVGHYYPDRFRLLRPLFLARSVQKTLLWIWDADNGHRSIGERVRASGQVVTGLREALHFERLTVRKVRWTTP